MESKKNRSNKEKKTQAHRHREQIGGARGRVWGMGGMDAEGKKAQTSNLKSWGSMVTIINNPVLYI